MLKPCFTIILPGLLLASPLLAAPEENRRYHYYPVEAQVGDSLLTALNRHSPVRQNGQIFHGHTSWNIRWHYDFQRSPGLCQALRPRVWLDLKLTLPELSVRAPEALRQQFWPFLDKLRLHEEGHVRVGQQTARQIEQALQSPISAPDCTHLEQELNARGQRLIEQGNAADQRYDAQTGHGRTQGASLLR